MDKEAEHRPSDDTVNPNLVIILTMKRTEGSSAAGSSVWEGKHDTNNNDGAVKVVKKESAAKEFCKNFLKKSSPSGDKNNNQSPPVTNQYTKVTVDGLMSQLTFQQNHQKAMNQQAAQHRNLVGVNQIDASKR